METNPLPGGEILRNVEEHEVLVEIIEVPRILLVEVVGELGLRVVLGSNALVVVHDAQSVAVEDSANDSTDGLGRAARSGDSLDGADVGEGIASTRALPERNTLSTDESGVLVVEGVALEINVGGSREIRQHDYMLEILRRESLLAALVEQSGHTGETVGVEADLESRKADERGRDNRQISGEILGELGVVHGEEVDGPDGVSALCSLDDHVIDRAHDEGIVLHGHSLVHLIEEHGHEGVELGGAGEGLPNLALGDRTVDLERDHLVEELGLGLRGMEHMRIVGCTIGELPALVLHGVGHFAGDLLNHRAILPSIHQNGGGGAAVGTVDENDLADVIDKGADVCVESLTVEDRLANIDEVGEILIQKNGITENLVGGLVYKIVDLSNFH